jgi:hypothetical protein
MDTEIYDQDWFYALPGDYKLFFDYLTRKCDTAGIWKVNLNKAREEMKVSSVINLKDFADRCNEDKIRILIFDDGHKVLLTTTVEFQCGGKLNEKIPAHRGVLKSLMSHKETSDWLFQQLDKGKITVEQQLTNSYATVAKGCPTLKDKDKDKDKEYLEEIKLEEEKGVKGKERKEEKEEPLQLWPSFEDFWNLYDKKIDRPACERKWKGLKQRDKEAVMDYIPAYKAANPDKQYRKNPESFFNAKAWENEIIDSSSGNDWNHFAQANINSSSKLYEHFRKEDGDS